MRVTNTKFIDEWNQEKKEELTTKGITPEDIFEYMQVMLKDTETKKEFLCFVYGLMSRSMTAEQLSIMNKYINILSKQN